MQISGLAPSVDTRPIAVTEHGRLQLGTPDKDGRPFISAASGLAAAGGAAWVVSDENGMLGRFDRLARPGALLPGLDNDKKRPDMESLVSIPQADGSSMLVAFGSGSKDDHTRDRALVQQVDASGATSGAPAEASLTGLYKELRSRLPMGTNIEGLALRDGADGAELLVFHRGRLDGDANTIFRLDAARAIDALRDGGKLHGDLVLGQTQVDLGSLHGERLGFADAKVLDDGRIAFVASAEGSDDANGNGEIKGTAVGILDASFAVQSLRPLDGPPRKVEGIELTSKLDPTASATSLTLVTDPDDAAAAAELLTVDLD